MKLEQLNSGSWHCRKTINGRTYSLTWDHKPNKLEIETEVNKIKKSSSANHEFDFRQAALQYIEINSNVLSPSTIPNYKSIVRNLPQWFVEMKVDRITQLDIQRAINEYTKGMESEEYDHFINSVKPDVVHFHTLMGLPIEFVRNASGLITPVMELYAPDLKINTKLPQKQKHIMNAPLDESIAAILKDSEGTDYELCYWLAVYGLRRSEIIAVTPQSIKGNLLYINTARVISDDRSFVKKTTKSEEGTRVIEIDDELARKIIEKGCVYSGYPGNILRDLHRRQDKLGIPRFRLHDFRVYYATFCHNVLKHSDAVLMQNGGWKTQETMIHSYRGTRDDIVQSAQSDVVKHVAELKQN